MDGLFLSLLMVYTSVCVCVSVSLCLCVCVRVLHSTWSIYFFLLLSAMLGLVWDINVKKGTDRPGLVIFPPLPGRYSPGRPSSPRPTRPPARKRRRPAGSAGSGCRVRPLRHRPGRPARPPGNAVGLAALRGRVTGSRPLRHRPGCLSYRSAARPHGWWRPIPGSDESGSRGPKVTRPVILLPPPPWFIQGGGLTDWKICEGVKAWPLPPRRGWTD